VLARLAYSPERHAAIASTIASLVAARRRVLVLTERTEHVQSLIVALGDPGCPVILLHGRLGTRARAQAFADLAAVPHESPFVVIATGRLIGEGFDDARLDALVAAMPFSWKGTVQQYVGRLMRPAPHKPRPLVVDFEDVGVRVLERMAAKRRAGYRLLGSTVVDSDAGAQLSLE
jgi:superfamily II DNA or RNA helicase